MSRGLLSNYAKEMEFMKNYNIPGVGSYADAERAHARTTGAKPWFPSLGLGTHGGPRMDLKDMANTLNKMSQALKDCKCPNLPK